ncbi:MAG TPA: MFS transporter [Nitrolancea sp.]|nr:MFS transporter [Nitrolancea sp.]
MSTLSQRAARVRIQLSRFPGTLWLLAGANLVLFTARGMTIPFLVIYFGQILGLGEGHVGAGIAASSIAGVLFTLAAAGTIDRFGPRNMVVITTLGTAATTALFPVATDLTRFFALMVVQGLFTQLYWPSSDTLATTLVPVEQAGEMFALLRVASALGTGAGGLIGGLMVAGGTIPEFQLLYWVAGGGIGLAGILVLALVCQPRRQRLAEHQQAGGSWREVLTDRRFMFSQIVMFILLAGLTQFQVTAPPYLHAQAGLGETAVGSLFTINTIIVVAAQLLVANRIARWGRGISLSAAALFWCVSYAMIGASPWVAGLPFAAAVVYTLGEMIFMPTSGVITVELAPERLRGRYLAFSSVIWGSAWGLASWAAGIALGSAHPTLLWPALIVLLLIGAAGGWLFDRTAPRVVAPVAVTTQDD